MAFRKALWDGTDPLYAPCLSWKGIYPTWKAPNKYIVAGWKMKSVKITPAGAKDDEHQGTRALQCRTLTQDLVRWWDAIDQPTVKPGTWHWLIQKYRTDAFSPIQDVKQNTRENYQWLLRNWDEAIGHMEIKDLSYEAIKTAQAAMKKNGRTVSYIHRMFTMLRTVARYGKALQSPDAAAVSSTLSEIRFRTAPSRQIAPTREQVYAVVRAADADKNTAFALGILLQYELILRAVDVRGQWLRFSGQESGIIRDGRRWQDGLTWDMFEDDLSGFSKVISKTAKSHPEPQYFDLTFLPDIQERLASIPRRVGPVIVTDKFKLPYTMTAWSSAWSRYRKQSGIPSNIFMMDLRAGGVTEAGEKGVDPWALRDAAQHANVSTTDKYSRGKNASGKVVRLRRQKQSD